MCLGASRSMHLEHPAKPGAALLCLGRKTRRSGSYWLRQAIRTVRPRRASNGSSSRLVLAYSTILIRSREAPTTCAALSNDRRGEDPTSRHSGWIWAPGRALCLAAAVPIRLGPSRGDVPGSDIVSHVRFKTCSGKDGPWEVHRGACRLGFSQERAQRCMEHWKG